MKRYVATTKVRVEFDAEDILVIEEGDKIAYDGDMLVYRDHEYPSETYPAVKRLHSAVDVGWFREVEGME